MHFIDNNDTPQFLYERNRRASMDRRFKIDENVFSTMKSHGVAGLFIDPENALYDLSSNQMRVSPRHRTAFHHCHLSEQIFQTIAMSLGSLSR